MPHASPLDALDIGAGTGSTTEVIMETLDPRSVVAVDISQGMLDEFQRRLGDPRIHLARCAINDFLATANDKFGLVVAMGTLHFIPDQERTIALAAERLEKDGYFIFTYSPIFPDRPSQVESQMVGKDGEVYYRQYPDDILAYTQQSGLTVIKDLLYVSNPNEDDPRHAGLVVARA